MSYLPEKKEMSVEGLNQSLGQKCFFTTQSQNKEYSVLAVKPTDHTNKTNQKQLHKNTTNEVQEHYKSFDICLKLIARYVFNCMYMQVRVRKTKEWI